MSTNSPGSATTQNLPLRQWLRMILVYLFIPALLFLCAGDLRWWQGWVFSLLIFIAGIAGRLWAEKRHPGLMAERMDKLSRADVKPWDRILAPLVAVSISFPLVIVAGLDHRFSWSAAFPLWLNILGLLLVAAGYGLGVLALVENRFFSGVVRIQAERGHTVCDTGPYRLMRHPGYAGNILPLAGIALGLSSWWTFIPAFVALVIVVIRTALEDRTLQAELPGYKEYTGRVRYRLLPGVW